MNMLQPTHLANENVILVPLQENDFERLYEVASDPLIWEQHPNKDRYQRKKFQNYFDGALASGGAFIIIDRSTGEVAGSTRYYHFNEEERSVLIGYTFYGRKFWGRGFNPQVKKLMLDHIFQKAEVVFFHVGAENRRSRIAMERLGAELVGHLQVAYHGEPTRENAEYRIFKSEWIKNQ
jgi:N-acetyltransferase